MEHNMKKNNFGFICILLLTSIAFSAQPERVIRFAHFTDIHITTDNNAPQGFAQALQYMQSMEDKPELLVTGGDHVGDSSAATDEVATKLFNLFKDIMQKNCHIPVKYCIGNHDIWGLNKPASKTTGSEEFWGIKRPIHEFNMPGPYYSFDVKNWHFIILQSVVPENNGYYVQLDDEQFKWLCDDLEKNKDKYCVIFSHPPILSVAAFFDDTQSEKTGNWFVSSSLINRDARRLKDLFYKYPNVKLCISGHLHLLDTVTYNGVTYICDGAVSGAWWGGKYQETSEGFGVFDLYRDGTFKHQYINYGWKSPAAKN
jgi:Icc protein